MIQALKLIILWLLFIISISQVLASRPLYYIDCNIEWEITSVDFLKPQLEECVDDNTFWCDVILWSGYQWPITSSHYLLSIDIKENTCTNLDTNQNYEWNLWLSENITLFRYNTWIPPKVGDRISGTIDTFGYLNNIMLNGTQWVTSIQQVEKLSGNIHEKLILKYKKQWLDTIELSNKISEINDKLRVFTLKIPEEKVGQYIIATERMLKNPRFQNIYEEIELLRINLYTW